MSVLMFGFLCGAFILGPLADRWLNLTCIMSERNTCLLRIGRKRNLVLTLLGMIFFNLVSAITAEYAVYALARSKSDYKHQ